MKRIYACIGGWYKIERCSHPLTKTNKGLSKKTWTSSQFGIFSHLAWRINLSDADFIWGTVTAQYKIHTVWEAENRYRRYKLGAFCQFCILNGRVSLIGFWCGYFLAFRTWDCQCVKAESWSAVAINAKSVIWKWSQLQKLLYLWVRPVV